MGYEIIEDINYSNEDINDLVNKDSNENYDCFKNISYLLMAGFTIIPANNMTAANNNVKTNSFPLIEVITDNPFKMEDYEQNVFSLENYPFCINKSDNKIWIEKILSFKSLQESWDGFGAIPLEIKSASNAISFLNFLSENNNFVNPTDVFPNPHGTVSLIWENSCDERLSLEIGNSSLSYYSLFNGSKPEFFNNVELIDANIDTISRTINSLY